MINLKAKTYLHGLNLDNWHPCWNLRLSRFLCSPNCTDYRVNKLGQHHKLADTPIGKLRDRTLLPGFVQPRLGKVINNSTLWDIEVDFEEARRKYNPKAPSRLSCLYLSDNNERAKKYIKSVIPHFRFFIVKVFHQISIHRADMNWFNRYATEEKSLEYLKNYWNASKSEHPNWEYFVDGIIEFIDDDELTFIRKNGAMLPGADKNFIEKCLAINRKNRQITRIMSEFYNSQRKGNLYIPNSSEPFKL